MTSNQQQHLLLVMKDLHQVKSKLTETEANLNAKLTATEAKLVTVVSLLRRGKETDKETVDFIVACSKRLMTDSDTVKITMPKFSEYHCSGKVWHSPPFYFREGYKMCLSVYTNGVGSGAGTHVSLGIVLLKGELDDQLEWPVISLNRSPEKTAVLCMEFCRLEANEEEKEVDRQEKFCDVVSCRQCIVNDCLTIQLGLGFGGYLFSRVA